MYHIKYFEKCFQTQKNKFCISGQKIALLKCFDEQTGKLISKIMQYYLVIVARSVQFCQTGKVSHFSESLL